MADEVASAADEEPPPWQEESIPSEHELYLRVHKNWYGEDGELDLGCFRNQPDKKNDGMSTDWCKYRSAERCREAATSEPRDNVVFALNVGKVSKIPDQRIQHTPIFGHATEEDNRAHTDVWGPKNTRTRVGYRKTYRVVLTLPEK